MERAFSRLTATMTEKLQVVERPPVSLAVQTTVFVPKGKLVPEAGAHTTVTEPSQASVPVMLKFAIPPVGLFADTFRLVGQLMTGGWLSNTVTVNVQVSVFPGVSVATHVTLL